MTPDLPSAEPRHPALYQRVRESFQRQGMMLQLGARLLDVGPGMCVLELPYSDKVTQQQDGFHGGAMGALLLEVGTGRCVLELPYSDKVTQQQGGFHGGAMGALADIAGGYAALTVAPDGMEVTTVEYKINFLAALRGGSLRATGQVVRAGKRIIVSSATVLHLDDQGVQTDCAVMQQTLVPVPKTY